MRTHSMLPKKDPLPSTQAEAAIHKGNHLHCSRECHLDVARHIVSSLKDMCKIQVMIRNQSVNEPF